MNSGYKTFNNWDYIDSEEYQFQKNTEDREIDNPGLNQDDSREQQQQDFDDSDDFHKHDDTESDDVDKDQEEN